MKPLPAIGRPNKSGLSPKLIGRRNYNRIMRIAKHGLPKHHTSPMMMLSLAIYRNPNDDL